MGQRLPEEKVPFPHVHEGLIWAIRVLIFNHSRENEGGGRGQGPRPGQLSSSWAPLQSDSLVVCEVDPELKEKLRKFRFRKETDNAAIISECHPPSPALRGWEGGGWEQVGRQGYVTDEWEEC